MQQRSAGGRANERKRKPDDRDLFGDDFAFGPAVGSAQASATYSGEAVGLRATAAGVNLTLADTGPLPSGGGNLSTSLATVNVLGVVSADALSSSTSGSGSSSQSQLTVGHLSLLGGLVAADAVKSNWSASCSGSTASTNGNSEIAGLVVAGQPVVVVNPNVALSLPGGISLIVNEQMSSPSGNTGATTVNALHVTGPAVDIVVASARSDMG